MWYSFRGVYVVGHYAYLTSYFGLLILDISDPRNPVEASRLTTLHVVNKLEVKDNFAYLTGGEGVMTVVNVWDPYNPSIVYTFRPGFYLVWGLDLVGSKLYVAEHDEGLWLLDVSNPMYPDSLGIAGGGGPRDVDVYGDYAYTNTGNSMYTFDISDPTNPFRTNIDSYCGINSSFGGIAVNYPYVYNATKDVNENLTILDITNPAIPISFSCLNFGTDPYDLFLTGDDLYLTSSGITRLDVSNPTNPVQTGNIDIERDIWDMQVLNDTVYTARNDRGFSIVDFSNPSEPELLSTYQESSLNGQYVPLKFKAIMLL